MPENQYVHKNWSENAWKWGAGGVLAGLGGLILGGAFAGIGAGAAGTMGTTGPTAGPGAVGATSTSGGGAVGAFFKKILSGGNGNYLPYLIMAMQTIPAVKQAALGKQLYEEGSADYETYMKRMNALISARAQQHAAWGTMISEGIQPGQKVPAIDYAKIFGSTESYLTGGPTNSPTTASGLKGPISHTTAEGVTGQSWYVNNDDTGFNRTGGWKDGTDYSGPNLTFQEYKQGSKYSDTRDWFAYKIFGKGH